MKWIIPNDDTNRHRLEYGDLLVCQKEVKLVELLFDGESLKNGCLSKGIFTD